MTGLYDLSLYALIIAYTRETDDIAEELLLHDQTAHAMRYENGRSL